MSDMFDRALIDKLNDLKQRVADLTAQESIKLSSTGLPYFPALTTGSVLFAGSGGLLAQDNANLSWDDSGNVLAINGVSFPVAVGTFTPGYAGASGGATWTYSIQTGFYTRIANRCFFNLNIIAATRLGAPLAGAVITGLPLTSNATANSHSPCVIDTIDAITLSATCVQLTARVPNSSTQIQFIETLGTAPSAATLLAGTGLSATAAIRISGHYMI